MTDAYKNISELLITPIYPDGSLRRSSDAGNAAQKGYDVVVSFLEDPRSFMRVKVVSNVAGTIKGVVLSTYLDAAGKFPKGASVEFKDEHIEAIGWPDRQ